MILNLILNLLKLHPLCQGLFPPSLRPGRGGRTSPIAVATISTILRNSFIVVLSGGIRTMTFPSGRMSRPSRLASAATRMPTRSVGGEGADRKRVVWGKRVDLGGRR